MKLNRYLLNHHNPNFQRLHQNLNSVEDFRKIKITSDCLCSSLGEGWGQEAHGTALPSEVPHAGGKEIPYGRREVRYRRCQKVTIVSDYGNNKFQHMKHTNYIAINK